MEQNYSFDFGWGMSIHKNTFYPIYMSHFRKYVHFSSNFDQILTGRPSADLQLRCDTNAEGIRVGWKNLVF